MGYCYTRAGKLCCDFCGEDGASKRACPHGYCQAVACCGSNICKASLKAYRKTTCAISCKVSHTRFAANEAERAAMLAAGKWVRCAAVGIDGTDGFKDCVKVWFRNGAAERVLFMLAETYHAFELLRPTTDDDYRAHGIVSETPNAFPASIVVS